MNISSEGIEEIEKMKAASNKRKEKCLKAPINPRMQLLLKRVFQEADFDNVLFPAVWHVYVQIAPDPKDGLLQALHIVEFCYEHMRKHRNLIKIVREAVSEALVAAYNTNEEYRPAFPKYFYDAVDIPRLQKVFELPPDELKKWLQAYQERDV